MARFEGELTIPGMLIAQNPWPGDDPPPMHGTVVIVLEPGEQPEVVDQWWPCEFGTIGVQVFLGWGDDGPYVQHASCGLRHRGLSLLNIPPDLIRFKLLRPVVADIAAQGEPDGPD